MLADRVYRFASREFGILICVFDLRVCAAEHMYDLSESDLLFQDLTRPFGFKTQSVHCELRTARGLEA